MAAKNEELKALYNQIKGRYPLILQHASIVAYKWLNDNSEVIRQLNIDQLNSGEYFTGERIQDGYSEQWGNERVIKGKQVKFVDLNFTGDFQGSIQAIPQFNGSRASVKVTTPSAKFRRLTQLFPDGILGLTAENANAVGWMIAPIVRGDMANYLGNAKYYS